MALSEAEIAKCAKWCTAPARKWQVLNRGKWKYQFHEKTLVRFVEEVKMDEELCPLLLEYLASDDCRSTLQLYGQAVDSAWTPIRAWYEISNKSVGNVHAVRLYHALALEPEAIGDGPYLVEDGCAYKISLTYYWRQPSVPRAPASESGVSYRIINLLRDPENGLYSYAIEKRERVQQDIPEYVTGVTTTHETREEVHHGVRGELDAGGKQASVGGGKIVRRKVTKNADCTHDVHNETVKELPLPKAERTARMTLNGLSVRVVNRNQSAPLPDPTEVGKSVSNRKTDGGLYDTVETTEGAKPAGKTGEGCTRDNFTHRHSVTKNEKELQNPETAFAKGQIVHKSGHLTGNGTANNTTETVTAVPQIQRYHWGDERGRHYVVKYRNQQSEINEAPSDADSVSLNDSVNAFGLHDGQCTYSYLAGRWKFSAKDYKFIKHGARQEYYDVKRRRRTRIWSHRKWIIEPRRIRGDAFWDYLNELARANPERTTPGTLGVKLIERYSDSDGNLLAEWVQVDLVQAEAWQVCDNDCNHAFVAQQMSNDHRFIVNSLLASLS